MLDTHCHLNDAQYEGEVDKIVLNYLNSGIDKVITIGCCPQSNLDVLKLVNKYESVFGAIGVHPDDCDKYNELKFEELLKYKNPKIVAVGEIGLDYYRIKDNKEKQIKVFESQIGFAKKYKLPIVIHCRDAYGDMLEILKKHAPFEYGAVMHCYSGSLEFAREIIKLGLKISFTGSVTFKNAVNLKEVAKNIPIDSFFFETDSPYLAPQSVRGTRNEPKNVWEVAYHVAELRNVDAKELINITDKTAKEFFKF